MINLYGMELTKLQNLMVEEGQKPYRAIQLYTWMYEKHATSFDEMSDISLKFREVLKEKYCLELPKIFLKQVSKDGTIKLLLELKDGMKVECVLMRYDYG
nr:23S rRNA (adenine(2503)-C(2))-methyltransferase RlmN [Bacilli bacterium]